MKTVWVLDEFEKQSERHTQSFDLDDFDVEKWKSTFGDEVGDPTIGGSRIAALQLGFLQKYVNAPLDAEKHIYILELCSAT